MTIRPTFRTLVAASVLLLGLTLAGQVSGQDLVTQEQAESSAYDNSPPGSDEHAREGEYSYLTSREFLLATEVLIFGLVIVVAEFILLRRRHMSPAAILRILALTLILVGTLFALTAGFGSDQIAPAMGLFGTIAGYLLGKTPHPPKQEEGKS